MVETFSQCITICQEKVRKMQKVIRKDNKMNYFIYCTLLGAIKVSKKEYEYVKERIIIQKEFGFKEEITGNDIALIPIQFQGEH